MLKQYKNTPYELMHFSGPSYSCKIHGINCTNLFAVLMLMSKGLEGAVSLVGFLRSRSRLNCVSPEPMCTYVKYIVIYIYVFTYMKKH